MPSVCLSTPDLFLSESLSEEDPSPSESESPPLPPDLSPEEEEAGAAPLALALDVDLCVFFAVVLTFTFFAFTFRESLDSVLSCRMEIEKDPPTPQLDPAAAALAAIWRLRSLTALTLKLPSVRMVPSPLPTRASVSVPETIRDRTGVMETPPAEPATELTVCSSFSSAVTSTLSSFVSSLLSCACPSVLSEPEVPLSADAFSFSAIFALSSITVLTSVPVTATAMPAPTPIFLAFSSPLASPVVVNLFSPLAVTFRSPPVSVTLAALSIRASALTEDTFTAIAPPMPISPSLYPALATTSCSDFSSALITSPLDSIFAFFTCASLLLIRTPTATDAPTETVLLPSLPEPFPDCTPGVKAALIWRLAFPPIVSGRTTVYSVPLPDAFRSTVFPLAVSVTTTLPDLIL